MNAVHNVTFVVTRRCGVSCAGCPVETKNRDMRPAIFKRTAGRIFLSIPGVKKIKFFGGEPLLKFALIMSGISYWRALGLSSFEIGTNGLALDASKVELLSRQTDIQININAAVSVKKLFLRLPNMIWNVCVRPDSPLEAVKLLRRISALSKNKTCRVNLLPEYYRAWSPAQLRCLRHTARELAAVIRNNGLQVEGEKRTGAIPLFNSGITVDTDGACYSTNLCLARIPESVRRRFLIGNADSMPDTTALWRVPRAPDLVAAFGQDAVASTYAADSIMGEYIHSLSEQRI